MSRRGTRRDPVKERFWRDTLRRQEASGLSVREFCARHSLAETAIYSWRAEIQRRDLEVRQSKALAQPRRAKKHSGDDGPRFLPVAISTVAAASPVEITLPSCRWRFTFARKRPTCVAASTDCCEWPRSISPATCSLAACTCSSIAAAIA